MEVKVGDLVKINHGYHYPLGQYSGMVAIVKIVEDKSIRAEILEANMFLGKSIGLFHNEYDIIGREVVGVQSRNKINELKQLTKWF